MSEKLDEKDKLAVVRALSTKYSKHLRDRYAIHDRLVALNAEPFEMAGQIMRDAYDSGEKELALKSAEILMPFLMPRLNSSIIEQKVEGHVHQSKDVFVKIVLNSDQDHSNIIDNDSRISDHLDHDLNALDQDKIKRGDD